MLFSHIHQALGQVRELRARIVAGQDFYGYSGIARGFGGLIALGAGVLLSCSFYPRSITAHAIAWGLVCAFAVGINYSAMLFWYLRHKSDSLTTLAPAAEAFPPLAVGALFTATLLYHGQEDLLFGTWMTLFGLTNLSSPRFLPPPIKPLGWFYIVSGGCCFFAHEVSFTNPWPMAIVFAFGEIVGGIIFHQHRQSDEGARS